MKTITLKEKYGDYEVPIINETAISFTVIIKGRIFTIPKI